MCSLVSSLKTHLGQYHGLLRIRVASLCLGDKLSMCHSSAAATAAVGILGSLVCIQAELSLL